MFTRLPLQRYRRSTTIIFLNFVELWNLTPPLCHLSSLICCPIATQSPLLRHANLFPNLSPSLPLLFLLFPPHSFGTKLPSLILLPPLLSLPLVSSFVESVHHFCIQMKRFYFVLSFPRHASAGRQRCVRSFIQVCLAVYRSVGARPLPGLSSHPHLAGASCRRTIFSGSCAC